MHVVQPGMTMIEHLSSTQQQRSNYCCSKLTSTWLDYNALPLFMYCSNYYDVPLYCYYTSVWVHSAAPRSTVSCLEYGIPGILTWVARLCLPEVAANHPPTHTHTP